LIAGWSSPVARQAHNLKVVGSNPAPATNFTAMKHDFMAVFVVFYAFSPFGVIFVRQGELPEMWRTKTNIIHKHISKHIGASERHSAILSFGS
jgi:hypothetical protein